MQKNIKKGTQSPQGEHLITDFSPTIQPFVIELQKYLNRRKETLGE